MKNFPIVKSRRLRSTPYTDRIESHGVSSYTVYNHMLLPASFKSLEADYEHLKKFVQVWDVAAERQVEISGKDSAKLVQLMTCRDLSKSKIGKCYYAPLIDGEGLLVNDPIINKLAEDRWWLSIADSDVIFFAKGLAAGNKFEVEITEPNVNILAIQGPRSDDLMAKLFGEEIRNLKFFNFNYYEFKGNKYFIARSGWSKQSGFEVYVEDNLAGQDLYDYLFENGSEFNVKAGCPNLIERIESALLSYGNDFDNRDNPFEANFDKFINLDSEINFLGKEKLKKIKQDGISRKLMGVKIDHNKIDMYCEKTLLDDDDNPFECGLDKYVNLDSEVNFLGKEKLIEIRKTGISKKLMGVVIDVKEINVSKSLDLIDDKGSKIGELRSGVYSPHFKKVIGIAMLDKPYYEVSQEFKISVNDSTFEGKVCDLPFI